jgi:hypothetical protein
MTAEQIKARLSIEGDNWIKRMERERAERALASRQVDRRAEFATFMLKGLLIFSILCALGLLVLWLRSGK